MYPDSHILPYVVTTRMAIYPNRGKVYFFTCLLFYFLTKKIPLRIVTTGREGTLQQKQTIKLSFHKHLLSGMGSPRYVKWFMVGNISNDEFFLKDKYCNNTLAVNAESLRTPCPSACPVCLKVHFPTPMPNQASFPTGGIYSK